MRASTCQTARSALLRTFHGNFAATLPDMCSFSRWQHCTLMGGITTNVPAFGTGSVAVGALSAHRCLMLLRPLTASTGAPSFGFRESLTAPSSPRLRAGPVFPFGFEMGFFAVESETSKLNDPGGGLCCIGYEIIAVDDNVTSPCAHKVPSHRKCGCFTFSQRKNPSRVSWTA